MTSWPILSLTTFLPLAGALLIMMLRGDDPAFVDRTVVSYDELAAIVDRVGRETAVDYESRTVHLGSPAALGALVESLAAGTSGATRARWRTCATTSARSTSGGSSTCAARPLPGCWSGSATSPGAGASGSRR